MNMSGHIGRLSLAFALSAAVIDAHAELGGIQPPLPDAVRHVMLNGALFIRTFVDEGGTTINEYATATGQIVAYTWQGPTAPDLHALLGPYDGSYRAGAAARSGLVPSLHAAQVAQPDVIVESGGQMRSYVGRAWLPAALPAGVVPDDLR